MSNPTTPIEGALRYEQIGNALYVSEYRDGRWQTDWGSGEALYADGPPGYTPGKAIAVAVDAITGQVWKQRD